MVFKMEFESEKEDRAAGEEDVYSVRFRNRLLDDDELTPEESAFMEGYDEAE